MSFVGLGTTNHCAGEGQQEFIGLDWTGLVCVWGNNWVRMFSRQRRIVRGVVFCTVRVILKESSRLVLSRGSCCLSFSIPKITTSKARVITTHLHAEVASSGATRSGSVFSPVYIGLKIKLPCLRGPTIIWIRSRKWYSDWTVASRERSLPSGWFKLSCAISPFCVICKTQAPYCAPEST
jgi:hypothetical protein